MPSVELTLAGRSYVVDSEPGLLARAGERLLPYWQGRPLAVVPDENVAAAQLPAFLKSLETAGIVAEPIILPAGEGTQSRSEEHTSELQTLMRSSYAAFCVRNQTHTVSAYHQHKQNDHTDFRESSD